MSDHTVWCWGNNRNGQLGNGSASGNQTAVPSAVKVSGLTDARSVTVGDFSSCALRTTGAVACWGLGSHGRLGNGSTTSSSVPVAVSGITNATSVSIANGSTWSAACASLSTGAVKCWGSNLYGVLGVTSVPNTTAGYSSVPVTVAGVTTAAEVALGKDLACSRSTGGTATCWGRNDAAVFNDPSLPPGNTDTARPPTGIVGLSSASTLSVGNGTVCAMSGGTATCLGGYDGSTPVPVDQGLGFTSVTATASKCGVTAAKKAYCAGPNNFGQIGDPALPKTTGTSSFPVPYVVTDLTAVKGLPAGVNSLGTSYAGACAVLANDQVWCWGYDVWGAVGTGSTSTTGRAPSRVVGI
jgi:alpha-tubulin suppressor-like RCC1 family protein